MAHEDGSMKALLIINDPPYGTERVYNARGPGRRRDHGTGASRTMDKLAVATIEADKILVL
jgi:hypothetical protein